MSKRYEQCQTSIERYLAKMDEIRIRMPKESGLKEAIREHAEMMHESVQAFILRAIEQQMDRDNT